MAVTLPITTVGSTEASSNQSRAKQARAKPSRTKKSRARRVQIQSAPNIQGLPTRKRTNLKVHEKREIIGITSFFTSACYKIVGPIFNIARQTIHGFCKNMMKEKVSKVPQTNTRISRVRIKPPVSAMEAETETEAEMEIDTQTKKGLLDGVVMAIKAICKLLHRTSAQLPKKLLDMLAFKDEFEKYLKDIKQEIVRSKGGKTRPEGSLFENFSLRWILGFFMPRLLFCCEIADMCSASAPDLFQLSGRRDSPISSLLVCNRDCSTNSDFDPVQCKRKVFFNNPQDFEQFTLSNFLIKLDEIISRGVREKILLLIDEVQWNLLRASNSAPLPNTKYIYVMVVPNRFRSILPFNNLAERFKDTFVSAWRNHGLSDPQYEVALDQQADMLFNCLPQAYKDSEIQAQFKTFWENVGMCA
ncbi:hypothetical protein BGX26_004052 [Mortierella sp. AD094]|nr:hypothetical protein BGX26_004052 [Mortierella sp. AD094]